MTLAIRDREHLAASPLLLLASLSLAVLHAPCPLLELSACVGAYSAGFGLGLGVGILVLRLGRGEGGESVRIEWAGRLHLSDLISHSFPLLLCPLRFIFLLLFLGHFLQFGLIPLNDAIVSLLSWSAAVLGSGVRLTHATGFVETRFRLRSCDYIYRASLPRLLMQFLRRCRGRTRKLHDVFFSHFLDDPNLSFGTTGTSCWLF